MDQFLFPGQQSDEKVLYTIRPHPALKYISFAKSIIIGLIVLGIFMALSTVFSVNQNGLIMLGILLGILISLIGFWWGNALYQKNKTFITDRRIIKFLPLSPFHQTVRALFWQDAIKCKSYHKLGIWEGLLRIGSIEVHAKTQDKDNVDVDFLVFYDDLANYIDKILYTYKNKPHELVSFPPFIPAPFGKRSDK